MILWTSNSGKGDAGFCGRVRYDIALQSVTTLTSNRIPPLRHTACTRPGNSHFQIGAPAIESLDSLGIPPVVSARIWIKLAGPEPAFVTRTMAAMTRGAPCFMEMGDQAGAVEWDEALLVPPLVRRAARSND
jgi:hypothetical protein